MLTFTYTQISVQVLKGNAINAIKAQKIHQNHLRISAKHST